MTSPEAQKVRFGRKSREAERRKTSKKKPPLFPALEKAKNNQTGTERLTVVSRLSIEQEQSVGFASEAPETAQREKEKGSGAPTETLPEKEEQEAPKKRLFVATSEGRNARQPAALPLD